MKGITWVDALMFVGILYVFFDMLGVILDCLHNQEVEK